MIRMAAIGTAIELQDNFTSVLYRVINSVNLGLSAMEDLHQTMNAPVDTASIEAARASINQATIAVDLCQYFRQKKLKGYAAVLSSSSSFCWGVI